MNIISGTARNIELSVPAGLEVRPTSGRARKALFDSLGSFAGIGVLDLCSGSGALALEAAIRGAERAFMVELSPFHCRIIKENIEKVRKAGVAAPLEVINCSILDVRRYLDAVYSSNLIFADPPYALEGLAEIPDKIMNAGLLHPDCYFILEHPADYSFTEHPRFFKERKYGNVHFSFFR